MKKIIIIGIAVALIAVVVLLVFKPFSEDMVLDQESFESSKEDCIALGGTIGPCPEEAGENCSFQCLIKDLPKKEDFPVAEIFKGKPAEVDYSSHPFAKTFYTRITEGAKEQPNFAGHYTIIDWGCGTSCQAGVVFDAETGKIYDLPVSEIGKEFSVDSSLLIVNPRKEPYVDIALKGIFIHYYKWENNVFELIDVR